MTVQRYVLGVNVMKYVIKMEEENNFQTGWVKPVAIAGGAALGVGGLITGGILLHTAGKNKQATKKLAEELEYTNENTQDNTAELDKVNQKVSKVEQDVKKTKQDVTELKTGQTQTQTQIAEVKKSVGDLETKTAESDGKLFQGMTGVDAKVGKVQETVTKLAEKQKEIDKRSYDNEGETLDLDYRTRQLEKDKEARHEAVEKKTTLYDPKDEDKKPEKKLDASEEADRIIAELEKEIISENPVTKPVEQPKTNVYNPSESEEQSSWRLSITPFYSRKMALSAQKDKPDDMNMYGVELSAKKGRFRVYAGIQRGESSESEDGDVNGLDYNGDIDMTHTTFRTGMGYDFLSGKRGRLTAKVGPSYTMEDVEGEMKIATPYGTEKMDINDSNEYFSLEGTLEGALKLTDNIELGVGLRLRENFDSDNVDRELEVPFGVTVKF